MQQHDLTVIDKLCMYASWPFKNPKFDGYFKKETQARVRAEAEACGSFELRMTSSISATYPEDTRLPTDFNTAVEVQAAVKFTLPLLPGNAPALGSAPVDYGFYHSAMGDGYPNSVKFDLSDFKIVRFEAGDVSGLTKQDFLSDWRLTIDTGAPKEHLKFNCSDGSYGSSDESFWSAQFAPLHQDEKDDKGLFSTRTTYTLTHWQPGENGALMQAKYHRSKSYPSPAPGKVDEDTTFSFVHTPQAVSSANGR